MAEETVAPAAEAEAAAPPPPDPRLRIAALESDLDAARDRLLRIAAEMENLRRRTEREAADARQYAVTAFARDLLPVVDNLRRALEAAPAADKDAPSDTATLVDGVGMTERELLRVLERNGVKRVGAVGQKFDPHWHQAVFEMETADVPPGTIAQLAQPGYAIADRVLRPALVAVAKAPRPAQGAAAEKPAPAEGAPTAPDGETTGGENIDQRV